MNRLYDMKYSTNGLENCTKILMKEKSGDNQRRPEMTSAHNTDSNGWAQSLLTFPTHNTHNTHDTHDPSVTLNNIKAIIWTLLQSG